MTSEPDNSLTKTVIGACIDVHREIGPGEEELAYEGAFSLALTSRGIAHRCQVALPLVYKGARLDCGYRLDAYVEERLPVELKAVDSIHPIHQAQLLTYLRLFDRPLGLLVNFEVPFLREGIKRMVLTARDRVSCADAGDYFHTGNGALDSVLGASMEVHRELGPGLLPNAYETCLIHELGTRGVSFRTEVALPLSFGGQVLAAASRLPLLVENRVPVVCLSVPMIMPVHICRMLALLRRTGWSDGVIINFNVVRFPSGIRRVSA